MSFFTTQTQLGRIHWSGIYAMDFLYNCLLFFYFSLLEKLGISSTFYYYFPLGLTTHYMVISDQWPDAIPAVKLVLFYIFKLAFPLLIGIFSFSYLKYKFIKPIQWHEQHMESLHLWKSQTTKKNLQLTSWSPNLKKTSAMRKPLSLLQGEIYMNREPGKGTREGWHILGILN